jgi:PAS domain S-box-containing protein
MPNAPLDGDKQILEMVAKGAALPDILDSLCRIVEQQASGVLASVLLLDGTRLRHGGAPSLPKAYTDAIDGAVIGPCAGSCGTAAYQGRQVIVEDIASDPLWADYRALALPHALRACWSTPVFSSQGNVIATFAMYYREPRTPSQRDQQVIEQITYLAGVAIERDLIHERLQRSEAYLADAQALTHTGSFVWDVRTKHAVHLSDEWYRIFEFDREKGAGVFEERWHRVFPDDRVRWQAAIDRAITERSGYELESRLVCPGGATKHVRVVAHPVLDASGDVVQFIGSVMDITERKHAEEERDKLRSLEADLAHINRVSMLGEFAASLAHELKQPITGLITNAGTCLRLIRCEPPNVRDAEVAAARIVRDGNRANEIIDRLRSFYRKDVPAQREPVDVNDLVREMLMLLRAEASRYSVSMHTELSAVLPTVTADRVQLQQVFMNLLLNAIEAMKESGGEVTVTSQRDPDGHLLIAVSDTGVGLPDKADQIFNAFFTTKPQGSGMGLAIGRSIVESHGGRLWATANSGPGATFHLTLPTTPTVTTAEMPAAGG